MLRLGFGLRMGLNETLLTQTRCPASGPTAAGPLTCHAARRPLMHRTQAARRRFPPVRPPRAARHAAGGPRVVRCGCVGGGSRALPSPRSAICSGTSTPPKTPPKSSASSSFAPRSRRRRRISSLGRRRLCGTGRGGVGDTQRVCVGCCRCAWRLVTLYEESHWKGPGVLMGALKRGACLVSRCRGDSRKCRGLRVKLRLPRRICLTGSWTAKVHCRSTTWTLIGNRCLASPSSARPRLSLGTTRH